MYDVRYNASIGFSSRDGLGEEGSSHSVSAPTRYPDSFLACYFAFHKNRDNNKITVYLTYLAFSFLSGCTRIITLVPEVFLDFSSRKREQATKRRQQVANATRRERKTSGYLSLESHFHADDSCQTRQIANKKSDQWQLSKHVLISRYFFKRG